MIRLIILILIFFYSGFAWPQSSFKKFLTLNFPEKKWVFFHPFIAPKCFKLTKTALSATDLLKKDTVLDGDWNGGQVDAFRHSYWMALMSQKIKIKKAYKLGIAHEKGNKIDWKKGKLEEDLLADSLACEMDLANNNIGLAIGCNYKELDKEALKSFIIGEIKKGKMKVILKDPDGKFLDCNKNSIDMNVWKGKWNIPKCLVSSEK